METKRTLLRKRRRSYNTLRMSMNEIQASVQYNKMIVVYDLKYLLTTFQENKYFHLMFIILWGQ